MDEQIIREELRQLIADVTGKKIDDISVDANLWTDLSIDSIVAIEITVAIERKYRVRIRDEQIPTITNIKQAAELVKQALDKKAVEQE